MSAPDRSGAPGSSSPGSRSRSGSLCPSASAGAEGAVVIGIVLGDSEAPRVAYLEQALPVTSEVLAKTAPVPPNQVLRTAARCAEGACGHYDGSDCTLAMRLVAALDPAVDRPPPCAIRPSCRWWRQEGKAACLRCPEVATESRGGSEAFEEAARVPAG